MAITTILRGQRLKLADMIPNNTEFQLGLVCNGPGITIDFSCFGLDTHEKLSDDRYMTFFNQPATPCGGIILKAPTGYNSGFTIALEKLPLTIHRLTVTAAIDGNGTMSQLNSSSITFILKDVEVARFSFSGSDFSVERALILLEIYRKDEIWRVAATGQGFNDGLDALVKHFGGTLAESTASNLLSPPPTPPLSDPLNRTKSSLEGKISRDVPQFLSFLKPASVALEKVGLQEHQAKVALCLDILLLNSLKVEDLKKISYHILALGCHVDNNASIDLFFFLGNRCCRIGEINVKNLHARLIEIKTWIFRSFSGDHTSTGEFSYEFILERIRYFYFSTLGPRNKPLKRSVPVYAILISSAKYEVSVTQKGTINQIRWSSYESIFWQFIGLGQGEFKLLKKLDNLSDQFFSRCYLDNANFFKITNLNTLSDDELYDLLMVEYPSWIQKAKEKNILVLEENIEESEENLTLSASLMKVMEKALNKDKVLSNEYEIYQRKCTWEHLESEQDEVEKWLISLMCKYGDEKTFELMHAYNARTLFALVGSYSDEKIFSLMSKYKNAEFIVSHFNNESYKYKVKEGFDLLVKYDSAELVEKIIKKQYWQGQTSEQLEDSIGTPDDIDTKVMKTKTTETWKYRETGKGRYAFRILLENGLVTGWQGKYDSAE